MLETTRLRDHASQDANKAGNKRFGENRPIQVNSQSVNKIGICGNYKWLDAIPVKDKLRNSRLRRRAAPAGPEP